MSASEASLKTPGHEVRRRVPSRQSVARTGAESRRGIASAVGLGAALALTVAAARAAPSVYPTGVTRYDPAAAYNCDVLFSAADGKTYLIDMNGHVLHRWNHEGFPSKMLDPALVHGARGEVGLQLSAIPAARGNGQTGLVPGTPAMFRNKTFGVVDWDGRVVWRWGSEAPGGTALQHHDWERLVNGDTLILANQRGRLPGFGNRSMLDDVIYDVDPQGRIVWTWAASKHLEELGLTTSQLTLMEHSDEQDYLHMNAMGTLGPNHWERSGDSRFAADNIMISSRNANFIAIVSRRTGHLVWRIGPDFPRSEDPLGPDLSKPRGPIGQLSGQHDAHMIPEGLPGAGDILVFDDEGTGGYPPIATPMLLGSRVLEIDPVKRAVVWSYSGTKVTMYSPYLSSAQRLPNGNTLIDEGIDGRFFQVTPQGRIVWEYVAPMVRCANGCDGKHAPAPGAAPLPNSVYRIQAVPYGWVPLPGPHSQTPVQPPPRARFHIRAR